MQALLTDTHVHSAVWGLRALGRAGVPAIAMAPRRGSGGRWSRYAAGRATGPDACVDPAGFADAVTRVAGRHGPLWVYPGQEESVDALLAAAPLPAEVLLPYPDASVVDGVRRKAGLADLAHRVGLGVPPTLYAGPAAGLDPRLVDGPMVLKAQRKGTSLGVARVVEAPGDAERLLAGLDPGEEVLLQARLEGSLAALAVVVDREGRLVARFEQRSARTWPAGAGPSAVAVGVAPDEELAERVGAALAERGFWGLAQLQFLDGPDGRALIDVNTRYYGSLALAVASGVNLPVAWHAVACGERLPPPAAYRPGVTYRHLEVDLIAALHGAPRLLVQRAPRPRVGAKWAADDPLPGVLLSLSALGGWLGRQGRRVGRRGR